MSYLASSNSEFGARSVKTPLNRPVQYTYAQSTDGAQFNGGSLAIVKRAMFALDAGSTNVVDDLFVADLPNCAVIRLPISGIWSLSWVVRFANNSSENASWFAVVNSKFFNDTTGQKRLGACSTAASNNNTTITSYFDAGDLLGLYAYSTAATNKMSAYNAFLVVTLVQPTAPRATTTPIVPPVTTS